MKNVLWIFLVALLAVDLSMIVQRRRLSENLKTVQADAAVAFLKAKYADEEEALLIRTGMIPKAFPRVRDKEAPSDSVEFVLIASVDDCTNSLESEVVKLNYLAAKSPHKLAGIQGFFVDESRSETADRFIRNLSPAPRFPVTVSNVVAQVPEASTPLVLVIRNGDGRILDAYKPIVQDLTKRDAFYARWFAALGLS